MEHYDIKKAPTYALPNEDIDSIMALFKTLVD